MNSEKFYIAAISAAKYLGSARVKTLLNVFGNAQDIWNADNKEIEQAGLPDAALKSFLQFRLKNPDTPQKLIEYCEKKKVGLCSIVDDDYPPILKEIQSPPTAFFYFGKLQPLAERIAIVGARDNSDQGECAALEISESLAAQGITIVSGAARGIDTYAHTGALKRGRTVAVLGCGIKFAFDTPNRELIKRIAENGVVMSVFNPSQAPTKNTFPARNKIIAGLSKGMVVVEAAEKSGSMIASNYAVSCGRDLFAISGSGGCNKLIRDGANPIKTADDVLNFYSQCRTPN